MSSNIGIIGVDQRSMAFARMFIDQGQIVVAYDNNRDTAAVFENPKLQVVPYLDEFGHVLHTTRMIFIFLKHSHEVDAVLEQLVPYLSVSDIIIDLSESTEAEVIARMRSAQGLQIDLLDASLMLDGDVFSLHISGNRFAFNYCENVLKDMAGKIRVSFAGVSGSAHTPSQGAKAI